MLFTNQCSCLANETVVTIIQLHKRYRGARNFAGSNFFAIFAFFSAIHKNKFTQIKITAKHFPAKIYSGVNSFTTQKYSTKKSCLFNHNLSLSFRNKPVYNEILTHTVVLAQYCLKICISIARTRLDLLQVDLLASGASIVWPRSGRPRATKSMLGTGYFLKIAKINSQQKNKSVLIAKISSRKTQKIAYPQK